MGGTNLLVSSSSDQIISALLLLLGYPVRVLDRGCHAEHHVVLFSRGHGRNLADGIPVGQFENHTGIWWEDQQGRKQCLATVDKLYKSHREVSAYLQTKARNWGSSQPATSVR